MHFDLDIARQHLPFLRRVLGFWQCSLRNSSATDGAFHDDGDCAWECCSGTGPGGRGGLLGLVLAHGERGIVRVRQLDRLLSASSAMSDDRTTRTHCAASGPHAARCVGSFWRPVRSEGASLTTCVSIPLEQCTKNPGYMANRCASSCDGSSRRRHTDAFPECPAWAVQELGCAPIAESCALSCRRVAAGINTHPHSGHGHEL